MEWSASDPIRTAARFCTLACDTLPVQVQEQLEPQYFVSAFQTPDVVWHHNQLRDTLLGQSPPGFDQAIDTQLEVCKPYVCAGVPGLSCWVQPVAEKSAHSHCAGQLMQPMQISKNRLHAYTDCSFLNLIAQNAFFTCAEGISAKRARDENIPDENSGSTQPQPAGRTSDDQQPKQQRTTDVPASRAGNSTVNHIKSARAQESGCIVYVSSKSLSGPHAFVAQQCQDSFIFCVPCLDMCSCSNRDCVQHHQAGKSLALTSFAKSHFQLH